MITVLAAALLPSPLAIIPKPAQLIPQQGSFTYSVRTIVSGDARFAAETKLLAHELGSKVGSTGSVLVRFASLPKEGYRIKVSPKQVLVEAGDGAGAFYAAQTLAQIAKGGSIPAVTIQDQPRFGWRGMHLDVSRHFFPTSDVKKLLDVMAKLKLNVFHWHLVDDGGWRLQIRKYPKLTSVGAWRQGEKWGVSSMRIPGPYGGFYTQQQVREIVAYAAKRHITVVPEIEMPGHTYPSVFAYPNLRCNTSDALYTKQVESPGANVYCAGKEEVFRFLDDVLTEVCELFPSKTIHIGGDEVTKTLWDACPDCQRRIQAEGLKDTAELQSYFIKRINTMLRAKGRNLLGWDEIMEGGLAPGATVMAWHSLREGAAAAKLGHDVVMTPIDPCYFGYGYEPNLERAFRWDPMPAGLSSDQAKHVLGVESCVWTEWLPTRAHVEYLEFPGLLGIAETAWSPQQSKNWSEFLVRKNAWLARLDALGVNYYTQGPTAAAPIAFLGTDTLATFTPAPGTETRYTTDGSDPDAHSKVYTGPISMKTAGVVRASSIINGRQHGPIAETRFIQIPTAPEGLVPGLQWEHAAGRFSNVPERSEMTIDARGVASDLSLAPWEGQDWYAVHFKGWLRIPETGSYTITIGSDDGAMLWLAGVLALDNGGFHAYATGSATYRLPKGWVPFEIGFVQGNEAAKLTAEIEGPGLPKRPLASIAYRTP